MVKKYHILFSVFLLFPFTGNSTSTIASDDLSLFRNVAEKLRAIKTISYHYNREFSYPSESYHSKSSGEMYLDFSKENDLVGFRYQYQDSAGLSVFNNAEAFDVNIHRKTINIAGKLNKSSFEGRSPIYNSIITLRNILPLVIEDQSIIKEVSDTLIANKSYYLLTFETQNKYPDYLGTGFSTTTQDLRFYNRLIVNKKTLLPLTLLQTKKGSEDLNRTDFTAIKMNPVPPTDHSWYYSSYLNEYKPEKQQSVAIIKAGEIAPDFSLTNYETGLKEELSKFRGHVVLLEFWIKNCGYCIEAVPKLNALNKKYKSASFRVLGLNTEDNQNAISAFVKKNQVEYPVFWGNNPDVNKNYGIAAFPQAVLIDKTGLIIYSGKLDTQKITELIDKSI